MKINKSPFKHCFKCGSFKPLNLFYRHPDMADGHVNKCKECNRKDVTLNRYTKYSYYLNYDRNRGRRPGQRVDPFKKNANTVVGNALRDGRITRKPCQDCGTSENVEAHHEDYSKPLEVVWLCRKHHGERHRKPETITLLKEAGLSV